MRSSTLATLAVEDGSSVKCSQRLRNQSALNARRPACSAPDSSSCAPSPMNQVSDAATPRRRVASHKDLWIRLGEADFEREHAALEIAGQGTLRPCRNVLREAVAGNSKAHVPTAKVIEHHQDWVLYVGERFRLCADSLVAYPLEDGIVSVASESGHDVAERLTERHASDLDRRANGFPLPSEGCSFTSKVWCQRGHAGGRGPGLGDQRFEQIEQDGPYHHALRARIIAPTR